MTPIRYHVWGEGPNDVGAAQVDGCYDALLARAASSTARLERTQGGYLRQLRRMPGPRRYKRKGLAGFGLHAYLATREAMVEGAELVVIGTDTDSEAGGAGAVLCRRKREELRSGYETACADVEEPPPQLVRLVPLRKLEAWLLADSAAFEAVMDVPRGKLPKRPESLTGMTDPKRLLDTLGASSKKLELARAASPDVLERECPVSYAPFRRDVRIALRR